MITIALFSCITVALSIQNIATTFKYREALNDLLQLQIDAKTTNAFLLDKINGKGLEEEKQHEQGFLNFLNQSRDWAFDYIEKVQQELNNFVSEVDPLISHFDTYGEVISVERPDFESMKKISKAYKELKTLLPEKEII